MSDLASRLFESVSFQLSRPGWYCTACSRCKTPEKTKPPPGTVCDAIERVLSEDRYREACLEEYETLPPEYDYDRDYKTAMLEELGHDLYDVHVCGGTEYVWDEPTETLDTRGSEELDLWREFERSV